VFPARAAHRPRTATFRGHHFRWALRQRVPIAVSVAPGISRSPEFHLDATLPQRIRKRTPCSMRCRPLIRGKCAQRQSTNVHDRAARFITPAPLGHQEQPLRFVSITSSKLVRHSPTVRLGCPCRVVTGYPAACAIREPRRRGIDESGLHVARVANTRTFSFSSSAHAWPTHARRAADDEVHPSCASARQWRDHARWLR